jgi:EmrB/QacA subfamily drug resistance transporter
MRASPTRRLRPGAILALVCGAQFMVVLDIAIVNVALPSLQADLGVAQSDLQWVVITYGLTLGGFLLLGGRVADLFGRRNVLVAGLGLFTASSLAAGLSSSLGPLVAARATQGLGAALAAPAALSILANTFAEGGERNKALGIFGAVGGSAASVGVIASGLLSSGPGWEWVFLINVPIGAVMIALILRFIPQSPPDARGSASADLPGAITVTAGLMAIVYGINKSVDDGWTSGVTLGFLVGGVVLLAAFVAIEARSSSPLLPLSMFRRRTLTTANVVAALVFASFSATIFQASLFMQQVLHYSAVKTGVAYLAIAVTAFVVAGAVAAKVVNRRGAGVALLIGQSSAALGLVLLARVPADAAYWADVFPGFLLLGIGIGFSGMAAQVAAFIGVEDHVAGLAGGMVETAREVGGALGTAIVATVAIARSDEVLRAFGADPDAGSRAVALTEGFQRGSLVAAGFSIVAALAAGVLLRRAERTASARKVVEVTEIDLTTDRSAEGEGGGDGKGGVDRPVSTVAEV